MTTRVLDRAEWAEKLAGTELDAVWPHLQQEDAQIVVVEDGARVVGCWAVIRYVHVEGVWIAPSHRGKGSVARRLFAGMKRVAQQFGARAVLTGALTEDVRQLLRHLNATKLPGEHYCFPVGD
ncbi:MAG TPA: GNAT family N-acetyltransferase [Gemmatimonadaceae bacterium]|nr:GNAT family N-acetyltransferase [Gemmatimonadaceae bacterium]